MARPKKIERWKKEGKKRDEAGWGLEVESVKVGGVVPGYVCASSDGERRISISHQPTSPFYSRQALASTPNVLKKSPGFDFQLVWQSKQKKQRILFHCSPTRSSRAFSLPLSPTVMWLDIQNFLMVQFTWYQFAVLLQQESWKLWGLLEHHDHCLRGNTLLDSKRYCMSSVRFWSRPWLRPVFQMHSVGMHIQV